MLRRAARQAWALLRLDREAKAGNSRVWLRLVTSTPQAWNEPIHTVFVCG
jgi:hypothetical protein